HGEYYGHNRQEIKKLRLAGRNIVKAMYPGSVSAHDLRHRYGDARGVYVIYLDSPLGVRVSRLMRTRPAAERDRIYREIASGAETAYGSDYIFRPSGSIQKDILLFKMVVGRMLEDAGR